MRNQLDRRTSPTRCIPCLVALLFVGCNATRTSPEHGAEARRAPAQASPAMAPDSLEGGLRALLAATDITGKTVGPAPADKQATAVVVFASWCQPCRNELAVLGAVQRDDPRLRVIGVNYYEEFDNLGDKDRLRSFLEDSAPWLQVVRADEPLFAALGQPAKIPALYLFDGQGKLAEAYLRPEREPPGRDELDRALARLLR